MQLERFGLRLQPASERTVAQTATYLVLLAFAALTPVAYLLGVSLLLPAGLLAGALVTLLVTSRFGREGEDGAEDGGYVNLEKLMEHHIRPGRKIAIIDPGTMLLQRWYFELRLTEESERCRRHGMTMTIVFVKAAAGTELGSPRRIAQLLLHRIRRADLATQISPDCYGLCLLHTDEARARSAIYRLLRSSEIAGFADIFVAVCPDDGTDLTTLLHAARAVNLNDEVMPIAPAVYIEEPPVPESPALSVDQPAVSIAEPAPPAPEPTPMPAPSSKSLARLLAEQPSGEVPLKPGESMSQAKARIRRAAKRAAVKVEMWEGNGLIWFERQESEDAASASLA